MALATAQGLPRPRRGRHLDRPAFGTRRASGVTYVIAEPCIGEKNGACVDVCPAACIHTTPEAPQNYIDPDICIECEQCVLVCPVNAVFLDRELPDEWRHFIDVNAEFFRQNKAAQQVPPDEAARILEQVRAYAARAGLSVAAVLIGTD